MQEAQGSIGEKVSVIQHDDTSRLTVYRENPNANFFDRIKPRYGGNSFAVAMNCLINNVLSKETGENAVIVIFMSDGNADFP